MAFASFKYFFIPVVESFLFLYGALCLLIDLSFTLSLTTLVLIASSIFYLKFRLLSVDPGTRDRFFGLKEKQDGVSFLVSHRTTALDAPENSLAGIRQTSLEGAQAVEFDVVLTSDNVPVLFHDDSIERVTEETGKISDMTLEEVQKLQIGTKHPYGDNFPGETVPTLEEAIEECSRLNLKMFIDIKIKDVEKSLKVVRDLVIQHPKIIEEAIIVSFDPVFLYKLRKENEHVMTALAWRPWQLTYECPTGFLEQCRPRTASRWQHLARLIGDKLYGWLLPRVIWNLSGVCAVLLHKDALSVEAIRKWKETGVEILAWPVNSPADKTFMERSLQIAYLTDTFASSSSI